MKRKSKLSRTGRRKPAKLKSAPLVQWSVLNYFSTAEDRTAVKKLMVEREGALQLDRFAVNLATGGVAALRAALIKVYAVAAETRRSLRATKPQMVEARAASSLIEKSILHLRKVRSAEKRGLYDLFGLAPSDPEAKFELGELGLICWHVEIALVGLMKDLHVALKGEFEKRAMRGERRKRLRTLVDALADWWESLGKSIAPNIDVVRRGDPRTGKKEPAYIYSRSGEFLELAKTVFSEIDVFAPKNVETVVTHAYRARLKNAQ